MIEQNIPCVFPLNSDDPKDVALAEHYNQHVCLAKIVTLMAEAAKEIYVPFVQDDECNIAVSHRPKTIYNISETESVEMGLPRKLLYQVYFYPDYINVMNNDLEGWNIKLVKDADQQEHIDLTPIDKVRHVRNDTRQIFKENAPDLVTETEFKTLFQEIFPKPESEMPVFKHS